MSHGAYVSQNLMSHGASVSHKLMSHGGLMSHETGLCLTDKAAESSQTRAGVAPGASASDHLLVSRAMRKILSPFGVPLMYRQ